MAYVVMAYINLVLWTVDSSIRPSVCPSVCLSVRWSVNWSECLSVGLQVCQFELDSHSGGIYFIGDLVDSLVSRQSVVTAAWHTSSRVGSPRTRSSSDVPELSSTSSSELDSSMPRRGPSPRPIPGLSHQNTQRTKSPSISSAENCLRVSEISSYASDLGAIELLQVQQIESGAKQ